MSPRSQREVYNYAFLANRYYARQRGKRVQIKSTKAKKKDQQQFCRTALAQNKVLFAVLNTKFEAQDKMFSVVAHVPDESTLVRKFGEPRPSNISGIYQDQGWMPMTRQANGLVAKLGQQTQNSSGQPQGPFVKKIYVDGFEPMCLLPIQAVRDALPQKEVDRIWPADSMEMDESSDQADSMEMDESSA
jgi:hypothetical protein